MLPPEKLHTVANIFDIKETNNNPVLSICSDLNTYVIKHNKGRKPCNKLVAELISSYFLNLWEIPTPQISLIEVKYEHYKDSISNFCQPAYFTIPCFGSRHLRYGMEFNNFLENIANYERKKFINKTDFLKIAIFDIWMANEDRTPNNPNLLINPEEGGYYVYAFDHESCFNTGNLHMGLYTLDINSSILSHSAVKRILGNIAKDSDEIDQVIKDCYFCIEKCQDNLNEILTYIPDEWEIDIPSFRQLMLSNLFNTDWKKETKITFQSFLQLITNNK